MATRLCAYEVNGVKCKNWVTSQDEDTILCPVHAGVMRRELSPAEKAIQQKLDQYEATCNLMSHEELAKHQLQLDALLEDVKLRQQAAASVKGKRLKAIVAAGANGLTEAQKSEIAALRGSDLTKRQKMPSAPKLSPEEREIQKMIKLGFTREKAIKVLGLDE